MLRPGLLLFFLAELIDETCERFAIGIPGARFRRKRFEWSFCAPRPGDYVDHQIVHGPDAEHSRARPGSNFAERHAKLIGDVRDHLRCVHPSPPRLAIGGKSSDAREDFLAGVGLPQGFHWTS